MKLSGKVAVITGAARGIGKACAKRFLDDGVKVVISDVDTDELEKTVNELGKPKELYAVPCHVARRADVDRAVATAVREFGRLDIMVNNAGVARNRDILEISEEEFDEIIGINLKGAFFGVQAAAKQMIAQGGGGHIINITSVHEDWPMPGNTAYCLSKGGMRMLTRTAGVELAPHKILVAGVGPGAVATPINRSTMANPAEMEKLDAAIPLGRMAQPEEIAKVVAMLASDRASYITATTVFADGGLMQSSPGL
jgi:NAD(P)-dependent dehydrogenase (short-subunit alcohol dehydrogenase family)